jgi:hypothetical protein
VGHSSIIGQAVRQGGQARRFGASPRRLAARDDMLGRFNTPAVAAILSRRMPALSRLTNFHPAMINQDAVRDVPAAVR